MLCVWEEVSTPSHKPSTPAQPVRHKAPATLGYHLDPDGVTAALDTRSSKQPVAPLGRLDVTRGGMLRMAMASVHTRSHHLHPTPQIGPMQSPGTALQRPDPWVPKRPPLSPTRLKDRGSVRTVGDLLGFSPTDLYQVPVLRSSFLRPSKSAAPLRRLETVGSRRLEGYVARSADHAT